MSLILLTFEPDVKALNPDPTTWNWDYILSDLAHSVQAKAPVVFVARWEHRHGDHTRVFLTEGAAHQWKAAIAHEWWDEEIAHTEPRPVGYLELADRYFEIMGERSSKAEYFSVSEVEIGA